MVGGRRLALLTVNQGLKTARYQPNPVRRKLRGEHMPPRSYDSIGSAPLCRRLSHQRGGVVPIVCGPPVTDPPDAICC